MARGSTPFVFAQLTQSKVGDFRLFNFSEADLPPPFCLIENFPDSGPTFANGVVNYLIYCKNFTHLFFV